jgi:hypothetical protein
VVKTGAVVALADSYYLSEFLISEFALLVPSGNLLFPFARAEPVYPGPAYLAIVAIDPVDSAVDPFKNKYLYPSFWFIGRTDKLI